MKESIFSFLIKKGKIMTDFTKGLIEQNVMKNITTGFGPNFLKDVMPEHLVSETIRAYSAQIKLLEEKGEYEYAKLSLGSNPN